MLSTFVAMPELPEVSRPGSLVRTLGPLVSAAVEGVVRDVIVLARPESQGVRAVVDHAGCGMVEAATLADALKLALPRAKTNVVLVLEGGTSFGHDFVDELAALLATGDRLEEALLLRRRTDSLLGRLLPGMAPVRGLMSAATGLDGSRAGTFRDLARGFRGARSFRARAAA